MLFIAVSISSCQQRKAGTVSARANTSVRFVTRPTIPRGCGVVGTRITSSCAKLTAGVTAVKLLCVAMRSIRSRSKLSRDSCTSSIRTSTHSKRPISTKLGNTRLRCATYPPPSPFGARTTSQAAATGEMLLASSCASRFSSSPQRLCVNTRHARGFTCATLRATSCARIASDTPGTMSSTPPSPPAARAGDAGITPRAGSGPRLHWPREAC
mmetsp:Transcript_35922/g.76689  ORF Transcript_35922/g.76689 Transcript_35922/m.76689 type:complete len:212 (-) Transcript_35922:379-1014(-)